ncbi:hypothetical protein PSAB6_60120 [Paraburkholderia sabiae]|nr:hypothetical protein PSAB6_60120 [Paraburkholderia sabiae]
MGAISFVALLNTQHLIAMDYSIRFSIRRRGWMSMRKTLEGQGFAATRARLRTAVSR